MLKVDEDRCVGCGLCMPSCPVEALKAWGKIQVDRNICNDCLDCIPNCPVDALREE